MRGIVVMAVTIGLALTAPASAHALTLKADRPETGWIRLSATDFGNATTVSIGERTSLGVSATDYAPTGGSIVIAHGAQWVCDRLTRDFVASATFPDGTTQTATASIKTPSCAKRFALSIRNLPGRIRVKVTDRWKLGHTTAPLCVKRPGARTRCRVATIGAHTFAHGDVSTRGGGGIWRLATGDSVRYAYVRPRIPLRLLATGDSMIQIVDLDLKKRLTKRHLRVRSDARVSTGLSKPFLLNWPAHAKRQARKIKPDVTVVAIGANDGFPFGDVDCCGDKWIDAYAQRVRSMMTSYARGNRGLVYWLTLPAPKPAQWRPIYPAVNRAIKRAAAAAGRAVRVVDIAKTFTPGFRFRQYMSWHGTRLNVRSDDGVHLSAAGAAIAETLVERQMRRDGVLR